MTLDFSTLFWTAFVLMLVFFTFVDTRNMR